jgi:uncharacterized protein (TIGR03437 family)
MRHHFGTLFLLAISIPASARAADYTISTAAGSSWVGDNGPALSAILIQAEGLASDFKGNLYIADAADHRVRRVAPDGTITTFAGTGVRGFSGDGGPALASQLNSPYGLATDTRGNLYIADLGNARVRRITPGGNISTIAGGGQLPAGGVNEGRPALMLALAAPRNIALDSAGNIYISDFSAQRVYCLTRDGSLTTAAGTGIAGSAGDGGSAAFARLNGPAALAFDRQDALYIADSGNHLVRKVAGGVISSYARASTPTGLVFDSLGTLYVADPSAGQIVRVPATGSATTALNLPARDLVFSSTGSLYASNGNVVLQITPSGTAATAAGGGNLAYGDHGPAIQARLNHPAGVAMDSAGNLYLADRDNNRIRRVAPGGTITTIAGTGQPGDSGDGASATSAQLNAPSSVSVDSAGTVYIADTGNHRVRKITLDGRIQAATNQGLLTPVYAIPDASASNIYIADADAGKILKAGANGVPATLATGLKSPRGLALDAAGNLYFTESGGASVRRLSPDGTLTQIAPGAWSIPRGVAVDPQGNLLVADTGLQQILRVDALGNVKPIAGTGAPGFSGDGAAAPAAQLGYPWDVALSPAGAIAIADLDNNRVRLLTPPQSTIITPPSNQTLPDLVNAASQLPGPAAPGMLMLLRNTAIDPADIADTQILFGPALARILSADASGILLVTPNEIAGSASANVEIFYKGVLQFTIPVAVAEAAPALFAIANQDGSVNSMQSPSARGSVISLYGTGLGSAQPTVTIETYPSEVLYAGPVANYPGLFQINATVPTGYLPSGNLSVTVTAASSSSQPGITLWVQ